MHKGGSRGLPANYRPVALTSHIVKMFERVIRKSLVAHLEANNLLPDGQHGFRGKRSCLTQLLSYWDTILDQMEEGKGVDTVYTDFAKAFEKCETGVLLHKLKECGIRGKVGHWLVGWSLAVRPDLCALRCAPGHCTGSLPVPYPSNGYSLQHLQGDNSLIFR